MLRYRRSIQLKLKNINRRSAYSNIYFEMFILFPDNLQFRCGSVFLLFFFGFKFFCFGNFELRKCSFFDFSYCSLACWPWVGQHHHQPPTTHLNTIHWPLLIALCQPNIILNMLTHIHTLDYTTMHIEHHRSIATHHHF